MKLKHLFILSFLLVLFSMSACGGANTNTQKTPAVQDSSSKSSDVTNEDVIPILAELKDLPQDYCLTYIETLNVGTPFESVSEKEYCRKGADRMFVWMGQNPQAEYCIEGGTQGLACTGIIDSTPMCFKDATKCTNIALQNGPLFIQKEKLGEVLLGLDKRLPNKKIDGAAGKCFSSSAFGTEFCYHSIYKVLSYYKKYYKKGGETYDVKSLIVPAPIEKFTPPAEPF